MHVHHALAAVSAGVLLEKLSPAGYAFVSLTMPFVCAAHCLITYQPAGVLETGVTAVAGVCFIFCASALLIGVCMSICLHRYFAHNAFATSRPFQFVLGIVSCFAYQGGPLSWAALHMTHHRNCDQPSDPHSVTQQGFWHAFVGWSMHPATLKAGKEGFSQLDRRVLTPEMHLVEGFHPVPVIGLLLTVLHLFGYEAMVWMCLAPMVSCRLITYLFNVEFHPDQQIAGSHDANPTTTGKFKCKSADKDRLLAQIVGESLHTDHHNHPKRSKRLDMDMPYWLTLSWMRRVGLVWDLK
mmetsp:Transcript_21544/g.41887  ORF Transcript_21544/g.41887 Transcript_21544/m.41887 type:complete len:296 (-) Transcript_21544:167-1054(-)